MLRKRLGQALAVFGAGTRHGHQEFHGCMGRDRATADLLLHAFREQLGQRQAVRYPTHAAIKSACQLLHAVAETLLQFGQRPAFFQSAVSLRPTQRAIQHQCFRLTQGPDRRFDRVLAELLKGRDALVAINDQKAIGLIGPSDDHDGTLLSRSGKRGQ
jgi:hypothetical protein